MRIYHRSVALGRFSCWPYLVQSPLANIWLDPVARWRTIHRLRRVIASERLGSLAYRVRHPILQMEAAAVEINCWRNGQSAASLILSQRPQFTHPRCPVYTKNSILPEIGRVRAEGVASENLICLIQDRPAIRSESGTPQESAPFSAESSFRYTQGLDRSKQYAIRATSDRRQPGARRVLPHERTAHVHPHHAGAIVKSW